VLANLVCINNYIKNFNKKGGEGFRSSKFKVQSSKFEKGGNRTIIDQLSKTNNSALRRDKDDNI
jgi:hypothetical protein